MAEAKNTDPQAAPSKSRSLILAFVLLLVGAGGAGAVFTYWQAAAEEPENVEPAASVRSFLPLESFIVNLADPGGRRFLRVGIDLGLEHSLENGVDPGTTALVRDTALAVLSTWESDALLTSEGKTALKQDLVRALRERVPLLGVREVYFNEFIVQR